MRNLFLSMLPLLAMAAPAGASLTDQEPSNNSVSTAALQLAPSATDGVTTGGGMLSLAAGDTDYVGIAGLAIGDIVNVSTTPLNDPPDFEIPDTIVGVFNSSGVVKCVGDDAFNNDLDQFPTGFGSLCRFEIDAAGNYFVGVTGFSANPFDGAHFEQGSYSVSVTITNLPEPGVLLQLASGVLGLAVLERRRRNARR